MLWRCWGSGGGGGGSGGGGGGGSDGVGSATIMVEYNNNSVPILYIGL